MRKGMATKHRGMHTKPHERRTSHNDRRRCRGQWRLGTSPRGSTKLLRGRRTTGRHTKLNDSHTMHQDSSGDMDSRTRNHPSRRSLAKHLHPTPLRRPALHTHPLHCSHPAHHTHRELPTRRAPRTLLVPPTPGLLALPNPDLLAPRARPAHLRRPLRHCSRRIPQHVPPRHCRRPSRYAAMLRGAT